MSTSPIDFAAIDPKLHFAPIYRMENQRLRMQVAEMREALELIAITQTGKDCRNIARRTLANTEAPCAF